MTKHSFWQGKSVFVTGHTGFKGGWLTLWLTKMGARVSGFALPQPTQPSFFEVCEIERLMHQHTIANVQDAQAIQNAVALAQPDVVFHLAAQPLVLQSYQDPVETYQTNVIGLVHLLEAVRQVSTIKAVVNITTDKCYENREWVWPYRENEALGGYDPYSSSKACAELITSAYRQSFLQTAQVAIATARAGNVIGGGDWAANRLVPDFFRAYDAKTSLMIRAPYAIRPWQHVLEPLSGYLLLAQKLYEQGSDYAGAWNFGPEAEDAKSVEWIAHYLSSQMQGLQWQIDKCSYPHEAHYLRLDSSKAKQNLGWYPRWHLAKALQQTISWHMSWCAGGNMQKLSLAQIASYEEARELQ